MGTYKPAEWYDDTSKWMSTVVYKPPWPRMHWWVYRFARMCAFVPQGTREILDLGCGNGLFAAMLHHHLNYDGGYLGIDFSEGSIGSAVRGNSEQGGYGRARFETGDISDVGALVTRLLLRGDRDQKPFGLIVCAETLEHVKDDRAVVESIPSGMKVLITVPQFDAEAHLRAFPNWENIDERYGDLLSFERKELMTNQWRRPGRGCWMFLGERRA